MSDNRKRIERIITRAIDYNNGLLTSDAFAILENMDNGDEDSIHISFIKRDKIIKAINEILDQDDDVFFKPEPEPEPTTPPFSISLDEFNALPLYEQTKIYNEHPDAIVKLISGDEASLITKEMFNAMTIAEQSRCYRIAPTLVEELLNGMLTYIDSEVFK